MDFHRGKTYKNQFNILIKTLKLKRYKLEFYTIMNLERTIVKISYETIINLKKLRLKTSVLDHKNDKTNGR